MVAKFDPKELELRDELQFGIFPIKNFSFPLNHILG